MWKSSRHVALCTPREEKQKFIGIAERNKGTLNIRAKVLSLNNKKWLEAFDTKDIHPYSAAFLRVTEWKHILKCFSMVLWRAVWFF